MNQEAQSHLFQAVALEHADPDMLAEQIGQLPLGFGIEIDTELFADGFESGDVSAWGYTRTKFTNGKKIESSFVSCFSGFIEK